jgi:hypothetical protein
MLLITTELGRPRPYTQFRTLIRNSANRDQATELSSRFQYSVDCITITGWSPDTEKVSLQPLHMNDAIGVSVL